MEQKAKNEQSDKKPELIKTLNVLGVEEPLKDSTSQLARKIGKSMLGSFIRLMQTDMPRAAFLLKELLSEEEFARVKDEVSQNLKNISAEKESQLQESFDEIPVDSIL